MYEQLRGGEGRRIFYRAERYKVRDLFKRTVPDLALDRVPHTLEDVSLSGVGAYTAAGANEFCSPHAHVSVELGVCGVPLFEGRGEVARVDATPMGTKIGVRLLDRYFDVARVVKLYRDIVIRSELASFSGSATGTEIAAEYRTLCADVLYLLRTYRASLEHAGEREHEEDAGAALLASCEEMILPRWRELWYRANTLVLPIMDDPPALRAVKRFTELVVTPEFMAGSVWRRSYEKPMGYPGDYQIMNMVYDWRREGSTLHEKLVHRLGLDVAECIATRMVMMRQAIAAAALRQGVGPVRIASLGCGPAREVVDYLQLRELPRPLHFTLIDQEETALSEAYERSYREVIRLGGQATVSCLHASFAQLLKAGELFGKLPPQDLIYTVGLIDYLAPRRAKNLVAALYDSLAPGGRLIVGNMMATATSNLWPMEFICDWSVLYRDRAEMKELAAGLHEARIETGLDPTGRVCLLTVDKGC